MYDPELLQVIRQEALIFSSLAALHIHLAFIEPAKLKAHVERLFYGGELLADCRIEAGHLMLCVTGLTAAGAQSLLSFES